MDDYDRPATAGHVRELEIRLADMDAALRRIEERADETKAYRMETYPWLMSMSSHVAWTLILVGIVAILSVIALVR